MGRDINQVLDDIGIGAFHYVQTLLLGGAQIADGAEILVCLGKLLSLSVCTTAWFHDWLSIWCFGSRYSRLGQVRVVVCFFSS